MDPSHQGTLVRPRQMEAMKKVEMVKNMCLRQVRVILHEAFDETSLHI